MKENHEVIHIFHDENQTELMISIIWFRSTDLRRPHICQVLGWLIENIAMDIL